MKCFELPSKSRSNAMIGQRTSPLNATTSTSRRHVPTYTYVSVIIINLSPVIGLYTQLNVIGGRNTHATLSEKEEQALSQFPKKKKS